MSDPHRVSMRMLFFVSDLLAVNGVSPREVTGDLPSFARRDDVPPFITWSEYVELIERLGRIAGGAEGIARSMRATLATSYSELRALASFFTGPVAFLSFVTYHLNPTITTGAWGQVEELGENRVRWRSWIRDELPGSRLYFQGSVTLLEVFPTHFGLPEARVEVVSISDRALDCIAEFPPVTASVKWGDRLQSLPPHEREALSRASVGHDISPAELAAIMTKMDEVNRAAFAEHELKKAVRRAVVALDADRRESTDGWAFLDEFESGGRRFVIKMRKEVDVLSDRERQILARAALGLHDKEIAFQLGVADATVRVLLHRAAKKLGVRGRAEAISRFVKVRGE